MTTNAGSSPTSRWSALLIAAAFAVTLAGCSGLGGPGTSPDGGTATTDALTPPPNTTVTIRLQGEGFTAASVHVLPAGASGVRVFYLNNSSRTFPAVTGPADLPDGALTDATEVEPLVDSLSVSLRRADAQEAGGVTITRSTDAEGIVYSLRDRQGRLLTWNVVRCTEGRLSAVTVTASATGDADVERVCRG